MTGEAECPVLGDEKILYLGGMRSMAGEAPLTAGHRGVVDDHLGLFVRMAAKAERVLCMDKQFGALRVVRVVAGDTLSSLERLVFDRSPCL